MATTGGVACFVVAAWWVSTVVVMKLVWLGARTHQQSLAAFTTLALLGLAGTFWSRHVETPLGAYVAFSCALAIWGWQELLFLTGSVTGPSKAPCPPGAKGWDRFRRATAVLLYHEVALALTLGMLALVTWHASNRVATYTFLVLWVMRLSAKVNVFLGVRNVSVQLVPPRLRYLISYFRRARMNPLMPFSIATGVAVLAWGMHSSTVASGEFSTVSRALIGAILALAVLEHVFLAVPVPDALLWRWAIRSDQTDHKRSNLGAAP